MLQGVLVTFIRGSELLINDEIANAIGSPIRSRLSVPFVICTADQMCEILRAILVEVSGFLIGSRDDLMLDLKCISEELP